MFKSTTQTLNVPDAVLYYDIRSDGAGREPVLLIIGSPMGAEGFGTLAGHFTDRTVVMSNGAVVVQPATEHPALMPIAGSHGSCFVEYHTWICGSDVVTGPARFGA